MKKPIVAAIALVAMAAPMAAAALADAADTLQVSILAPDVIRVSTAPNPYADRYIYDGAPAGIAATGARCAVDPATGEITLSGGNGVSIRARHCADGTVTFYTPAGESQYGTGQFQDGYTDVKNLSRRLTQVNTQISLPMIISSAGYGILWNNCGLTEFNPGNNTLPLVPVEGSGESVDVDVTGTSGNVREHRDYITFEGSLDIAEDGDYALLLDVGQSMARKHYLAVDGEVLTAADNLWLPPTTSVITHLDAGSHRVEVRGVNNDRPEVKWRRIDGSTTFSSPGGVTDYTVIFGSPDRIVAGMRALTGEVPMLPKWALGYIHCRERYFSQADVVDNAREFRRRGIPLDVIVQDWQWWGNNGWNAMIFDHDNYPDPKAMVDTLHAMDVRMMLSVWAKVDKNSLLGKQMEQHGSYIPGTDWVDFFSPEAAEEYWQAYRANLLPTGIDAWWQDATEPENDDLHGRRVGAGSIDGDDVRNVFPIVVNDRVYRGMLEERPDTRPMILTRSAAPGIQRYGVVTWSGDVGNDWQTLKRQISGGLGQMAAGVPWWTYDAGGFFRPGDQYTDPDYQARMVRWIQTAVFLPFMRVHGYQSRTEPWHYSVDTRDRYIKAVKQRYELLPYLYSEAARVSREGYTLMRPLVFDFPTDAKALEQTTEYMLGRSLLVCPVVTSGTEMEVYLPDNAGGWYDYFTGEKVADGAATITVDLHPDHIPVYVRGGSVLPLVTQPLQSTADVPEEVELRVYPGADAELMLYDDDGTSMDYLQGKYSVTPIRWHDATGTLEIGDEQGLWRRPYRLKQTVI